MKTKSQKRSLRRDWSDARVKVAEEGCCRLCGHIPASESLLEAAHVIGRKHDPILSGPNGGKYVYVHPDSIIPLCGPFTHGNCHMRYDRGEVDLLPFLRLHEQVRAVEDADGIISALKKTTGGVNIHE